MHKGLNLQDDDCIEVRNIKRGTVVKLSYAWWKANAGIPNFIKNYDLLGPCDKTKALSPTLSRAAVAAAEESDLSVGEIPEPKEPKSSEEETPTIEATGITVEAVNECNNSKQLKAWARELGVNLGNAKQFKAIKNKIIDHLEN